MANNQTFTLNIKALFDAEDVKNKLGNIQTTLSNLKMPDKMGRDITNSFITANKALDDFILKSQRGVKTSGDATGISRSFENVTKELNKLDKLLDGVRAEVADGVDLSHFFKIDEKTKTRLAELTQEIDDLKTRISNINTSKLDELNNILSSIKKGKKAKEHGAEAIGLFKEGEVDEAIASLDKLIEKYKKLEERNKNTNAGDTYGQNVIALTQLKDVMVKAREEAVNLNNEMGEKTAEATQLTTQEINRLTNGINEGADNIREYGQKANEATSDINNLAGRTADFNKELDQVKSRITYFFSLNNAIGLVKRSLRDAFQTVKELDKAMTETAVVTDFTVGDMWDQLPEYTKRANELGVSTKAAYEAATIYYQQGLKTNEVVAMSNETLKMARIAGLDAAVATDRMTNAIRGFNMEINEANAQRIDDVYSRLAAISASNVDEISTAMTKVASLANSANMEFETTSAFLAQMIETTRESAETAGTALKTVVARFSEVKKLVNEDQLKGQDDEGQLIDVNKVSAALRTAGIDLNRYFLGEVGLDDIFMELASKWDSLTVLQQRYIATQAAGSRQQSRFIAMMSDYARTQELVGEAYNANGAAAKQFAKTQESLESKLARLTNAWHEFTMGLSNNEIIKFGVDRLTDLLNLVNKLTSGFGKFSSGMPGVLGSLTKFVSLMAMLRGGSAIFKNVLPTALGKLGKTTLGGGLFKTLGITANVEVKEAGGVFKKDVAEAGRIFKSIVSGAGAQEKISNNQLGLFGSIKKFKNLNRDYTKVPNYQELMSNYNNSEKFSPEWYMARANLKQAQSQMIPKTLFGAVGNSFVNNTVIGGKISTGLGSVLGKIGIGSGAALGGAATLAATLGTIAVVAGVAGLAIKKAYDASPAGQVKIAEKYAAAIDKTAVNAKKTRDELKSLQNRYNELTKAINDSTTALEHGNKIKERNDYINSLLEENQAYAKYIDSTFENGELVLTIKEDQLTKAIKEVSEGATNAAVSSSLANAEVSKKQANLFNSKISNMGVNLEEGTIFGRKWTEKEQQTYQGYAIQAQNALTSAQNQAKTGFAQMLQNSNLSDEIANSIATIMSQAFVSSNSNLEARQSELLGLDKSANKQTYLEYFGTEAPDDMSNEDIAKALATEEERRVQAATAEAISSFSKTTGGSQLVQLIAGEITTSTLNLEEVVNAYNNATSEQKEILSQIAGISSEADINSYVEKQLKAENGRRQKTASLLLRNSSQSSNRILQLIDENTGLTIKEQESLEKYSNTFSQYGKEFNSKLLDEISNSMLSGDFSDSELENFAKSLNDNPIKTLDKLKKIASDDKNQLQGLAKQLQSVANIEFSPAYQVQYLLTSESFDQLSDKIEDFIEENNELSADNIRELADSCEDLNILLKNNTISAKGLATILNKGIATSELTDGIIAAVNALDDLEGQTKSIIDEFKNFDPGYDENDINKFITTTYESITENLEKGAYGNNQIKTYLQELFGADVFNADKLFEEYNTTDFKTAYLSKVRELTDFLRQNAGGSFKNAWKEVASKFDEQIQWVNGELVVSLNGMNTDEFISMVSKKMNWSETLVKAMVADLKNNSANAAYAFQQGDGKKAILDWVKNLKFGKDGFKYTTSQELANISAITGFSVKALEDYCDAVGIQLIKLEKIEAGYQKYGYNLEKDLMTGEKYDYDKIAEAAAKAGQSVDEFLGGTAKTTMEFTSKLGDFTIEAGQSAMSAFDTVWEAHQIAEKTANIDMQANGNPVENMLQGITNWFKENANQQIAISLKLSEGAQEFFNSIGGINLGDLDFKVESLAKDFSPSSNSANTNSGGANSNKGKVYTLDNITSNENRANTQLYEDLRNSAQDAWWNGTGDTIPRREAKAIVNELEQKYGRKTTLSIDDIVKASSGIIPALVPGRNYERNAMIDAVLNSLAPISEATQQTASNTGEISEKQDQPVPNYDELSESQFDTLGSQIDDDNLNAYGDTPDSTYTGKNGSGGSSEKEPEEWKNEFDWLYNIVSDLEELQRQEDLLQKEQTAILHDQNKTGHDLYKNLISQYANLRGQLAHQQELQTKRSQELRELVAANNQYEKYVWYNTSDKSVEIDWNEIEAIQDKEIYDAVKAFADEVEGVESKIEDTESAILDIEEEMHNLEIQYRDAYIEFENRVEEALIQQYQDTIDQLSTLNDTITESNNNILSSIQEQLDLERQIRDNTKTEEDIADKQARLAYLQRDTTGGNETEILKLQQEIEDAQENYTDTLVDQSIQKLQNDNEKAAQQRQQQISMMQEQLDWNVEQGAFNDEVSKLLDESRGSDGKLLNDSQLVTLLRNYGNWDAMTEAERDQWSEELEEQYKQWDAYEEFMANSEKGTFWSKVEDATQRVTKAIGDYSQSKGRTSLNGSGGSSGGSSGKGSKYKDSDDDNDVDLDVILTRAEASKQTLKAVLSNQTAEQKQKRIEELSKPKSVHISGGGRHAYAKGGLNDYTGWSWLDGTPSEPEYVLNARQTEAFLKLADILPSFIEHGLNQTSITGGNVYVELTMNVDQISNDYDVDRIVDRVKADIETAASYRNVNSISLLR